MNKKEKTRFLKNIVRNCLLFTAVVIVACYVAAWFGVNTDSILTHTCAVFGGEMVLSAVLRIVEDRGKKKEGNG